MAEIIRLTCPTCGGKLELTEDIERFACSYCGNEHIVIRRGGIVSLKPVVEELQQVRISADRYASELALVRLKKEIYELQSQLTRAQVDWGGFWRALLFGVLAFMLFDALWEDFPICIGALVILTVLFFGLWLYSIQDSENTRRKCEPLLQARREEYRRHQEIVEKWGGTGEGNS